MPHLTTQQLIDFNEGRLEAATRAAAHAHLQECALCAHEVAMFQEAMSAFVNGPSAELPPLPAALVDAAVARARAEFSPDRTVFARLSAALTSCLDELAKQISQTIVPPLGRTPAVGMAQERKLLHVLSETVRLPESDLTVHLALSDATATLVVEGANRTLLGAQVVAITLEEISSRERQRAGRREIRRVLGILDEHGTINLPAGDVLTLHRLEVVPPPS